MEPAPIQVGWNREWTGVALVTMVGLVMRLWPVGHLGLNHFDEGIYALVASWSLQPKGLATLDPTLIPYAPPGYPILGGLAYLLLGRSDGAMIAVSQIAGTLTIPVVAWLARRTFGPGAGFAAAVLCAFSGPHIAYSRMALTDASFLLAWLVAIGAGMRFLERPGASRAILMGLAVGLVQQFKYNGWLSGAIVIATALVGIVLRPEQRTPVAILRTFGWGGLAALVAWLVVWPWYAFVEAHDGYTALLRHQRSYLGGFADWWPNFLSQSTQALGLSGGDGLILPGLSLLLLCSILAPTKTWESMKSNHGRLLGGLKVVLCALFPWLPVTSPYWLGLVLAPWLLTWASSRVRIVGIWWLLLTILTPFYHPYARLWLPYHAANWLVIGFFSGTGYGFAPASSWSPRLRQPGWLVYLVVSVLFCLGAFVATKTDRTQVTTRNPGLFDRSDSLYQATVNVSEILPRNVSGLRLLVRPPVTFYLAGRVALLPMANSDPLLKPGNPQFWALVDSAILRSETGQASSGTDRNLLDRFAKHWEIVEEFPSTPSLPTLFDLDPDAARRPSVSRASPLWLLRPRTAEVPR